jgi:hypothetical protein
MDNQRSASHSGQKRTCWVKVQATPNDNQQEKEKARNQQGLFHFLSHRRPPKSAF